MSCSHPLELEKQTFLKEKSRKYNSCFRLILDFILWFQSLYVNVLIKRVMQKWLLYEELGWFDFVKSCWIMAPSSHKLYFWPTWRMAPSKLGYPSKQRCKAILKFWFHSSKVKNLTASKFFEIEILLYKSSMLNMYQKDLCQYLL